MAIDPLAERLDDLRRAGSVTASSLSRAMRSRLDVLFRAGALVEEKAGGGRRVRVADPELLERWIDSAYPSGLSGTPATAPARAKAVADFAHSKRRRRVGVRPTFVRGFGDVALTRSAGTMPLGELTRRFTAAGVLFDPADPWRLDGTLALVENLEFFLHAERAIPGIDAALYTAGRLDGGLLAMIAEMPDVRVVHAGDYDPTGLDEYLRVREQLGPRASLFVPEGLADRVSRYGRRELLTDSVAVLERIRKSPDPAVRTVVAVLDAYGKGLEQEALLLGIDATS